MVVLLNNARLIDVDLTGPFFTFFTTDHHTDQR